MASELSLSDDEDDQAIDVRVAHINDVFESGSVVYAACRALNHKHGYEETEHALLQTAAIARRCAASVKAENRALFIATIKPKRKQSISLISNEGIDRARSSSGVFIRLSPRSKPKTPISRTSHSDLSLDRSRRSGKSSMIIAPPKRIIGGGLLVGGTPQPMIKVSQSPASNHSSFPSSLNSSRSNSRRNSLTNRKMSFTPPIKIEGKQGQNKNKIVGVVVVDKRDAVFGVGPIAVHPNFVAQGIGGRLMQTVLEDWADCKSSTFGNSIRLTVESYNASSLSLYISLGFQLREPLVYVRGNPSVKKFSSEYNVRPLVKEDLPKCQELMQKIYGYTRVSELREAIDDGESYPFVVLKMVKKKKIIVGYTSTLGVDGHGCANTMEDMKNLITGVNLYYEKNHTDEKKKEDTSPSIGGIRTKEKRGSKFHHKGQHREKIGYELGKNPPPKIISLLVPAHDQHKLLRWCISSGMKVVKQLSLLSLGNYRSPNQDNKKHVYFPSILY